MTGRPMKIAAVLALGLVALSRRDAAAPALPETATGPVADHPLPETDPPQGRDAARPTQIPIRGWRQIVMRTAAAVMEHRVLAVAAGVTFFILLAFVPALSAFVSIYGLFADRATIAEHMGLLEQVLPVGSMAVVQDQVTRLATAGTTAMTFASVLSLLIALWSANGATKAMIEALNVAYDEREKRSFVKVTLISFAMTLGMVGLGLAMIVVVAVLPAVISFLHVPGESAALLARWPVILLVMLLVLAGLYRFGPSRDAARWRWISPGALVAAVGLVVFSMAFSIYASNFANFNETYGSLGALMGLLTWLWLGSVIVLVGAELNAEAEKQTNRDTTTGAPRPMGNRNARAADVVAL
ncbi:YihY/virulence factor BrkB family protein [Cereibacter sp. SYSU M97828]|nr:YihY/virulence factor BrkB family protein [Cereibacter flavus]